MKEKRKKRKNRKRIEEKIREEKKHTNQYGLALLEGDKGRGRER